MSILSSILSLFSLSVLDTRLDPPDDEKKRQSIILSAGPNRWYTKEYYAYGIVFLVTVPLMFKAVIDASSDSYGGILPRWDVNFNFSMLRMVSFNMDRFLAVEFWNSETLSDKDKPSESTISEKERIDTPLPLEQYNLTNYLSYVLYSPLYMAGPILTFNDFYRQTNITLPSITPYRIYRYALRLIFCILVMEFILHYMYVVAICETRAWEGDTPFQISMIAFFNLNVIWLKLLIPWRFFRFWAMTDGIDPPENMIRCMDNNYSALSFWRAWHRSFNKWITRYIYIPMGGSRRNPVLNSLVVFSFVAIWHDIQLRLLIWGWLVVLFILPEILATVIFPAKKWDSKPIYRHICAVGAVLNIWMMMIANLVGFAVGTDGILEMLNQMFKTTSGLLFVIVSTVCLFVGVQAMFELRESEKRQGVYLRC